jgi:hypothetical protein
LIKISIPENYKGKPIKIECKYQMPENYKGNPIKIGHN